MKASSSHKSYLKKLYEINWQIKSPTLRVINDKGNQLGILSKKEALKIAQEQNLDLVLVARNAQPPVAKIIDFNKFVYQEEKKAKESKKGTKKGVTKDINFNLFIGQADFERLVKRGKEFLRNGHQLRINLILRGREIDKKDMAFELINRFINSIGDINISKPPRLEGRVLRAIVIRKK
ncbi:MAG: translation initiation factor IF-3 [Patescibacteria group bacterium]|nr:translation initiation factor IF-3 [Patescibacteria group bacterium]